MFARNHLNANNQKLYQEMKFLQSQNQRLRDQLSDARDLININKIQIDVLSKDQSHDKQLIDVIYNYRQQVDILLNKNAKLSQNYQKNSFQKLVIQQLNQQLHSQQKSIEELHKSQIKQLSDMIKSLQQKMQTCEKNHQSYDNITGFVERNRDLITPLEQAIQFKNKQDAWREEISYLKGQLAQHKKNQENLLLANGILRNKVVSLQAKLAMPNKNLGQILDKSLKRLMLYFIQTQKKMLTGDDSDSEQEDLQLIAPELIELFSHKQKNSRADAKVPALNILKVRNQQMKGNQKIKQQLLRRNTMSKDQKIERIQVQLQFTRRSLTKNMIQLKCESQRRKILQKICEQLEQRNQFLIRSNQLQIKRMQKLKKDLQSNKQKIMSIDKIQINQDEAEVSFMKKNSHKNGNAQNRRMRQYQINKYLQNVQTPFEYKLHLQLLAKDLDKNQKLRNIRQGKMKRTMSKGDQGMSKLKKSTSNPFLYFNERRGQIMEVQPQTNLKDQFEKVNQRHQQTQFLQMNQNKYFEFNGDFQDFQDM